MNAEPRPEMHCRSDEKTCRGTDYCACQCGGCYEAHFGKSRVQAPATPTDCVLTFIVNGEDAKVTMPPTATLAEARIRALTVTYNTVALADRFEIRMGDGTMLSPETLVRDVHAEASRLFLTLAMGAGGATPADVPAVTLGEKERGATKGCGER